MSDLPVYGISHLFEIYAKRELHLVLTVTNCQYPKEIKPKYYPINNKLLDYTSLKVEEE